MEIALGVSMTSTTVRMVLVEGDKADGLIMECDQFSTIAGSGSLAASVPEQVSTAILATQQSASRQGHNVSMCGIAVTDTCDVAGLRQSLAARGLGDVVIVSESQAVAALAHAVARAIGYTKTALLFVTERAATLSLVDSVDRSVVEVANRDLHNADTSYVLAEMVSSFSVEGPQGLFVVDSTGRIATIKPSIEGATSLPTTFPEEPAWALARGSALTAAAAPRFEASTQGFAYAQDPDDDDFVDSVETATGALLCADEVTRRGLIDVIRWSATDAVDGAERLSGKFISIGSLAASIVVVGAVTVVMALAASTAPTSTQHLVERGQVLPAEPITVGPSAPPPTYKAAAAPNPAPVQNLPPALPPPPPPMTVAVQQAPRAVTSQAPTSTPRAAQPVAAAQAPVSTPKPVAPVVVDPPPETASAPLDLQPVNAPILPPTAELPFPALAPIAPAAQVPQFPQFTPAPPVAQTPAISPEAPFLRWLPAFLRPRQQVPAVSQTPPTQMPVQQWTPPAQQWDPPVQQWTPPVQQWNPPVQQWTPPVQQWTPPVQQWTPPVQQWTPPVQQAPLWPQSPWDSGDFRGGSRLASSDGGSVWPMR